MRKVLFLEEKKKKGFGHKESNSIFQLLRRCGLFSWGVYTEVKW